MPMKIVIKKGQQMSFNECKDVMHRYDLMDDIQNNFVNFVYKKISRNTKNRFVEKDKNSVDILLSNHPCIKVIPIFKSMNKDNLSLDKEMEEALAIINEGDFKYVYFVYPKNDNFDKHIQIKVNSLDKACSDYMVKIIPYSLDDLIKTKKR